MKTYEAIFDEEQNTGVYGISLVLNPAMEGVFVALSKQSEVQFKEVSKEERKVVGLVLEPNKLIYRNDGNEEYNIVFNAETIKNLSYNFFKQNFQKNSTIEHNENNKIENVTFVESWIVEDRKTDKQQLYGFDYPEGSWLATLKIDNDEVWENYVKTGKVQGFSIDGLLSLKEVKMSKNQTLSGVDIWFSGSMLTKGKEVYKLNSEFLENGTHELMTNVEIDVVNGVVTDIREVNFKSEINMSKEVLEETQKQTSILTELAQSIKTLFSKPEVAVKLGEVKTADGTITIEYEGEELVAGVSAWIVAEDGTQVPVPVGEHPLEDGRILVVTDEGIVAEVKEAMPAEPAPAQEPMSAQPTEAQRNAKSVEEITNVMTTIKTNFESQDERLKKVETKLAKVLEENEALRVALSETPAKKRVNATPTQAGTKLTLAQRIEQKLI